jgi:hypothetical protein
MSKIHIATRGSANWRERLGDPEKHWKRKASAMETAVSWERAAHSHSGLPEAILSLFNGSKLGESELLLAVAEHKVPLRGTGGDSQCDVWALVKASAGIVSLAIEAKAAEPFGSGNENLAVWLKSGKSPGSEPNRMKRWEHIQENLPQTEADAYRDVPYQILQRCAAAVIEARRFGLKNAAFIVQSFSSPDKSFQMFGKLCKALGIQVERGGMNFVQMGGINLGIGWAECPFATDAEIASAL